MRARLLWGLLCVLLSFGCTAQQRIKKASLAGSAEGRIFDNLRARAEHDLRCPRHRISVGHFGGHTYGVTGCGMRATYALEDHGVRRWVLRSAPAAARRRERSSAPTEVVRAGGSPGGQESQSVDVTRGEGPHTVLNLSLAAPSIGLKVKLKAKPALHPEFALLGFESWVVKEGFKDCEVKLVTNGELVALPAAKYARLTKTQELLAFELPIVSLAALAEAQRVVAQICADRIEFSASDLAAIRDFFVRFREEQALAGTVAPSEAPVPNSSSL